MTIRQANRGIYWAWKSMKQRCQNPKCQAYKNYGERGIAVCNDWQQFEPFYNWAIENGYEQGLDLDRVDNDGNYSPENCRWTSRHNNINNRRVTIYLTANGITKPLTDWEIDANITKGALESWVLNHGMDYAERRLEDILEHGYRPKDYGYSHRKAIINLDNHTQYISVREAAKDVGLAPCTITNAMNHRNGQTSKGRFIWADEKEKAYGIYGNGT